MNHQNDEKRQRISDAQHVSNTAIGTKQAAARSQAGVQSAGDVNPRVFEKPSDATRLRQVVADIGRESGREYPRKRPDVAHAAILSQELFHQAFALERKRSERSKKPFLLMLLDTGSEFATDKNSRLLGEVLNALASATREIDITGWYATGVMVGVMFTEISPTDRLSIVGTMLARVSNALRDNVGLDAFHRIKLSFHVFPDDWDHDGSQPAAKRPTCPAPCEKEEGHLWVLFFWMFVVLAACWFYYKIF